MSAFEAPQAARTQDARDDHAALSHAHAALAAGAGYLIARAAQPCAAATIMPNVRLRRSGNCLNELDRFLSVLIAECARARGIVETGMPADGVDDMPRRVDNARRLRRIAPPLGAVFTNRLRAIGRIRDLACGDSLQRPGTWLERDMALATAGQVAIVAHPAQAPDISDRALGFVAEFYLTIADRLLASFAHP